MSQNDTTASGHAAFTPQDRIAVLEDLVDFHCDRNAKGAEAILRIAAELGSPEVSDLSADESRATIAHARVSLTWLGRQLAIDSLNDEATQAALRRWLLIAAHPEMLS